MERHSAGGGSARRERRRGTTLVEVVIAIFILMVMAIGSGAYLFHGRAGIGVQRNRRAALEMAASRLEHIRSSNYADLEPPDSQTYFVSRQSGLWQLTLTDPSETATVNGFSYPLTTSVRKVTASSPTREYLVAAVTIGYRLGSNDRIALETIVSP